MVFTLDLSPVTAPDARFAGAERSIYDRHVRRGGLSPAGGASTPLGAALRCYPVATSLARLLDLNDLHALSRGSREIRGILVPLRAALVRLSLRCTNAGGRPPLSRTETLSIWRFFPANPAGPPCARDLVAPCQACGVVVCRNCIAKPPMPAALRARARHLCPACVASPLAVFSHACVCRDVAHHVCRACAGPRAAADTAYARAWLWRRRYGPPSDDNGLGTGAGDGAPGVRCARGAACLAAEDGEAAPDGGKARVGAPVDNAQPAADDEAAGEEVRKWCTWCDGVVTAAAERELEELVWPATQARSLPFLP